MTEPANELDLLARDIRIHLFREAAATARVPQAPDISRALGRSETDVRAALHELAVAKVLMLAPNDGDIWAANPFCAVPSGFRVTAAGKQYWGICIWDALGIAAAIGADAVISAPCGDCGAAMTLEGGTASSSAPRAWCTLRFRRITGGTTSASPEARCCSSGTKSTWIDGARRAISLAESRSHPSRRGGSRTGGTGTRRSQTGAGTRWKRPRRS